MNEYLRDITGQHFTAKDFRTWNGTVLAALSLCALEQPASRREAHESIVRVTREVAEKLGNRPAACRKYYLHPAVLEAFTAGELIAEAIPRPVQARAGLTPIETRVLRILQQRRAKALPRAA